MNYDNRTEEKKHKVKVLKQIGLTDTDIVDLVVTALEGGIGYWSVLDISGEEWKDEPLNTPHSEWAANLLLNGGELTFIGIEDDEVWKLNLDMLLAGIERFINLDYDKYGAFGLDGVDFCNLDADAADSIFQLALFKDIVFA